MRPSRREVNNDFYDQLGDRWYTAQNDPIALLRNEGRVKNPWVAERLEPGSRVLDIACGAGFLANFLGERGFTVTGLDLSEQSLEVARRHDLTGRVRYDRGNALNLPYAAGNFDVVTAMDMLEHVEDPVQVVSEAARVLRPGGRFFFHTFNRTWLARLLAIHAVRWFVPNTPRDFHVYRLFIRPEELAAMCNLNGLRLMEFKGIGPRLRLRTVWPLLTQRRVPEDFEFQLQDSLGVGYLGMAIKAPFRAV